MSYVVGFAMRVAPSERSLAGFFVLSSIGLTLLALFAIGLAVRAVQEVILGEIVSKMTQEEWEALPQSELDSRPRPPGHGWVDRSRLAIRSCLRGVPYSRVYPIGARGFPYLCGQTDD